MKEFIKEFIKELKTEGFDLKQIADFLCDGEALAARGISDQRFVEECYDLVVGGVK